MRKVVAVMLISGSLAASAATAFAATASDRESKSTDGIRFMARDVTNVAVSSQPAASTSTLPIAHNHDRTN